MSFCLLRHHCMRAFGVFFRNAEVEAWLLDTTVSKSVEKGGMGLGMCSSGAT
jgi:hypothetical protein